MVTPSPTKEATEKNICLHCGIDIDMAREMFPQGFTTCKELGLDKHVFHLSEENTVDRKERYGNSD